MSKESVMAVDRKTAVNGNSAMLLLCALGLAAFLVNADNRAVAPVLPAIANDLHIRESTAGLLISAYAIPYGLFQLVYGPIADRIGKIRTISIALVLFSIGTVGCGFVDSFYSLLSLRIITGIFAAGIIPISLAQIGDSFTFGERPKAISLFMSFSTSGQALGIVIGALVSQYYSWKWLFLLIGVGGVPAILLFSRQKNNVTATATTASIPLMERYRRILSSMRARLVYMLIFLEGSVFFGGFTYLSVYANQNLQLSYLMVGLLTALFSLSALFGSRFITRTIEKVGQKRMPFFGSMIMTAAYAIIWVIPTAWALAIGFILLGIGFSFCHSTLQTFATELLPEARGTAMSLFAFFLFIGTGIGPAVLGWVYDWGGAGAMLSVTTISFLIFSIVCKLVFQSSSFKPKGSF
jgi:predicted MFS family arabinose efflux permease